MKTLKTGIAFTLVLLFCTLMAHSQKPSFFKYHVIKLDGSVVQRALQNPDFHRFNFSYADDGTDAVLLVGYAENANSEQLSDVIRLRPLSVSVPKRFKNLAPEGHLYLSRQTLIDHNVDGSEDYVLSPRKCVFENEITNFVSYRFSNRAEPASGDFADELLTATLKSFILNPSPPY